MTSKQRFFSTSPWYFPIHAFTMMDPNDSGQFYNKGSINELSRYPLRNAKSLKKDGIRMVIGSPAKSIVCHVNSGTRPHCLYSVHRTLVVFYSSDSIRNEDEVTRLSKISQFRQTALQFGFFNFIRELSAGLVDSRYKQSLLRFFIFLLNLQTAKQGTR